MASRFVFDTNVLVSATFFPGSVPHRAVAAAQAMGHLLFSADTFSELRSVLLRPKFVRYATREDLLQALADFELAADTVQPEERIAASRDPSDDKFLEVAVSGRADALVTGDADLLALHPFRGIPSSLRPASWPVPPH